MVSCAIPLAPSALQSAIIREPLVVSPETTIAGVIAQMSGIRPICHASGNPDDRLDDLHLEVRSSCVLVVENKHLVGILTEQDVVRFVAQQSSFNDTAIRDVMTHPVITLHESDLTNLLFVIDLLHQHHIRHLPILDEQNQLVGLVTHESLHQISEPINLLRLRVVSEVMTREVIYAPSDCFMLEIAHLMAEHGVSCVVLVEDKEQSRRLGRENEQQVLGTVDKGTSVLSPDDQKLIPVGIITERDLVQFQALGLSLEHCLAQAVMTTLPFAIKPETSLWRVDQLMKQYFIQRVLVTGEEGELLGIVTQSNLLKALNPLELYNLAEVLKKRVVRLEAEKVALLESRTVELEREVEARTLVLKTKAEQERLLTKLATQIRSSLSLQTILETTAQQVRQVLGCDRVNIWQFVDDWQALVVAESTDSALSLMGEHIDNCCFKEDINEIYCLGHISVVTDIHQTEMSDCHRKMLANLQIRSKIWVPLSCGDKLWGFLNAAESQYSRSWKSEEVELLQALSEQLAIALQQATTHHQLQEELKERQQVEARLRESEQRYATLAAAVPVGIFRTDAMGYCTYVNDRWCEIAGLSPEEAVGAGWQQGLHPDDRDQIASEWSRSALENRPFQLEYRFQRPDGKVTWVYGQSVAERDANGQVVGYVGTVTDISALKEAESALQQSETQSQAILSAIPDLMFLVGADGIYRKYITTNREFDMLAHITDPVGTSMGDVLPTEIMQQHFKSIRLVLATGELQVYEQQVQVGDRLQHEEVRVVKNGEDEVLFMIRDITHRKQAEQQLQDLIAGTAATTGQDFFPALVGHIAKALNVAYALVTECIDEELYVLAFWANGALQSNFSYHPANTPCYLVLKDGEFYCDSSVQQQFPADVDLVDMQAESYLGIALRDTNGRAIGNLCILDKQPLHEPQRARNLLRVFAARAAAELERQRAKTSLEQLNQALEAKIKERTAALQERERFLQTVLDTFPLSVFWKDQHSIYLGCNQNFLQDAGLLSVADIIGKTDYDMPWKETEAEAYRADDRRVMDSDTAKVGIIETRIQTTGNQIWLETNKLPLHNLRGEIIGVLGTYQDITVRKQAEQTIRQQVIREKLLRETTQRIRQSLDLQTIFDTACQEIRQVIQAHRVGIFKFYPGASFNDGEFVAESVVDGFPTVVGIRVHDHCFGEKYAPLYAQGRYYVIDDIYQNDLSACHTAILAQFQVRANVVMPLLCNDALWGLLCLHQCETTRHWQQSEVDFTQQLANQLAIAIQQASLYEKIQTELSVRQQAEAKIALQLRQQQALGAIVQKIRESLDVHEILATVVQQVKDVIHSDRVIVFQLFDDGRAQIVEEAVSREFPALKNRQWENEIWSQDILKLYGEGQPRIVPNVMTDSRTSCLSSYTIGGHIQSKIVAPILQEVHSRELKRWVIPGKTIKLWGILVVHACQEKRVWQVSEARLLQQIANQLAIAIQQASLFDQLQQELAERQQAQQQLTERNQQLAISNEELARATRLKDEFLANMSHELRTPLNAILGMTEGLQEQIFGEINTQQNKAIRTIGRSGSHLLELINDILDVSKIESGQVELDCMAVAVAPLCTSSLVFIKQQALQKRIQLSLELPANLPDLFVDERRIRQVLINLLNNAVKFTPEGGRITLEANLQPSAATSGNPNAFPQRSLRIAVTDTGIGIAPENIKKLFQPFTQIDSALNREYSGTGLGLALVKRLVELHGGQVELISEVGVGSCFTINLPCATTSTSTSQPEIRFEPNPQTDPSEPMKAPLILLAEDNEANISTLSSYLRAKGYHLLLAKNGQDSVALAQSENPDLILMDIQIPGIDGLEAIKQIRCDSNLVDVPIVALTALAMVGDRERCLAAGANEYLSKPVKLKQLVTTIQQLLAS